MKASKLLFGCMAFSATCFTVAYAQGLDMDRSKTTGEAHPATDPHRMTEGDFLAMLHHANQTEIELGNLAKEKASSQEVRDFGDRMVRDHQKADTEVENFARDNGIQISRAPGHERGQGEKPTERLQDLSGAAFDREFVNIMVKDHQRVIDYVTAARGRFTDPKLDQFTDKLLPTLKMHRDSAESLQNKVGREKTM